MHSIKKYYLRFSQPEDLARIKQFYAENPSPYAKLRREEFLRDSVNSGLAILLEEENGNVVGSSFIYPHKDKQTLRNKFNELASTQFIVPGFRGLFNILTSTKVLKSYIYERPEEGFIFGTISNGFKSKVLKEGYNEITDPEKVSQCNAYLMEKADMPILPENLSWYDFDHTNFPRIGKQLVEILDNPVLDNGKTKIEISFERIEHADRIKHAIRAIASMDDSNSAKLKQEMDDVCDTVKAKSVITP